MEACKPWRVICLCAQWCGVCRDYAATFAQVAAELGSECEFTWIDIEDEAELVDAVDVVNFPTLLITLEGEPLFFGPVTPHAGTLSRLVQSARAGEFKPLGDPPEVKALASRVSARHRGG